MKNLTNLAAAILSLTDSDLQKLFLILKEEYGIESTAKANYPPPDKKSHFSTSIFIVF